MALTILKRIKRTVTQIVGIVSVDKDGEVVTDSSGNPAGNVIIKNDGSAPLAHNRYIQVAGNVAADDIKTLTWPAAAEVTAIRIKGIAAANAGMLRFVFDASPVGDSSDTTQALAWLTTAVASEDTDVEYFEHVTAVALAEIWSDWYEFGGILRRLDVININGTDEAVDVYVESS